MGFFNRIGKRELDIKDALTERKKKIVLCKKPYILRELLSGDGIAFLSAWENIKSFKNITDFIAAYMQQTINLCFPGEEIDFKKMTMSESLNFIVAFVEVNDLDRIISNFLRAMPSILKTIQAGPTLPKQ